MSFTCTWQETTAWETVDSPVIWGYAMLLPPMKANMPSDCISARSARMCESGFTCAILAGSGCQLAGGRQPFPYRVMEGLPVIRARLEKLGQPKESHPCASEPEPMMTMSAVFTKPQPIDPRTTKINQQSSEILSPALLNSNAVSRSRSGRFWTGGQQTGN
jgi:hypothetical protein